MLSGLSRQISRRPLGGWAAAAQTESWPNASVVGMTPRFVLPVACVVFEEIRMSPVVNFYPAAPMGSPGD